MFMNLRNRQIVHRAQGRALASIDHLVHDAAVTRVGLETCRAQMSGQVCPEEHGRCQRNMQSLLQLTSVDSDAL